MDKQPLEEDFDKTIEELRSSINKTVEHLYGSIQEYLTSTIDLPKLLKMLEEVGLSGIMGIGTTPMPGMDYYLVLGLNKTATNSEIKERYLEIMKKIHPDVSGKEMTFLTTLVNTAYDMIWEERNIKRNKGGDVE